MADKDYSQLTSLGSFADTDLIAMYPVGGPLKKVTWATFKAGVITALGSTYLVSASNLSDLNSASSARANLGLGTAATLSASDLFQVANNLSEVASAATARSNLGAAAASAPTITSGMTFSGSTKQNVQAAASTSLDVSLTEFFTKSMSANTTFTFDNATAAKAQVFLLELTVSSSAVATWPASVDWSGGIAPTLPNGKHLLGFVTFNGGTDWDGILCAVSLA